MKKQNRSLLIIEDDPGLQSQMKWCFGEDIEVITAEDSKTAITALRRHEPQVVTLDLGLPPDPGGSTAGFALLHEILNLSPKTKIIVITGHEEKDNAVKSVSQGAYDFYQKPVDAETLTFVVERAFRLFELEQQTRLYEQSKAANNLYGIITSNPEMLNIIQTVEKIAPTDFATLILGEAGTGKELLARALHSLSNRADMPFNSINCAAIPDHLLEIELFGSPKATDSSDTIARQGKILQSNHGSLFIDEIGEMPVELQARMLRFMQEQSIIDPETEQEIKTDVRIICATQHDLNELISAGKFREDLFYLISEITLDVPALRERQGDVVIIANAILDSITQEQSSGKKRFNKDALGALEQYSWPGNVRELINKIKRAAIMSGSSQITVNDLELDAVQQQAESMPFNLREVRSAAERKAILRALNHCQGKIAQAARLLGVTRPTLYTLLEKYDIHIKQ